MLGFLAVIRTLDWPQTAADLHPEIRLQLTQSGSSIGDMDMLLAAHALSANAILVTNNQRHFQRIQQPLRLENSITPIH